MITTIAQAALDAAPAGVVKWFFVCAGSVILVASTAILGFRALQNKDSKEEETTTTPGPKSRYNHGLAESRHAETSRRISVHDSEIEQLWSNMRHEVAAIREENARKFEAIMLSLGRIEGELKRGHDD